MCCTAVTYGVLPLSLLFFQRTHSGHYINTFPHTGDAHSAELMNSPPPQREAFSSTADYLDAVFEWDRLGQEMHEKKKRRRGVRTSAVKRREPVPTASSKAHIAKARKPCVKTAGSTSSIPVSGKRNPPKPKLTGPRKRARKLEGESSDSDSNADDGDYEESGSHGAKRKRRESSPGSVLDDDLRRSLRRVSKFSNSPRAPTMPGKALYDTPVPSDEEVEENHDGNKPSSLSGNNSLAAHLSPSNIPAFTFPSGTAGI
ncbi:hypothetical protein C8R43DRAFT_1140010 [Mycena crocata]|nr:hypothetical protein C8R43DRAFT_1140010 [Mycena crocata]